MKVEIRETKEDGIIQITTLDERWYQKDGKFVPSVTWIAGYYPKGVGFYKWLADKGWDEAQAIKQAAGDKGSKVHKAVEALINGEKLSMDAKFTDSNGEESELTVEEWECLMSFVEWWKEVKPEVISAEQVVFTDRYAGTVDLVCKIGKETWLIDFKTGSEIWPEYELQVSAYQHALRGIDKVGILQLNYKRNKTKKYKFTEIEDKFDLFESAIKIWANENEGVVPKQKDYPVSLSLK